MGIQIQDGGGSDDCETPVYLNSRTRVVRQLVSATLFLKLTWESIRVLVLLNNILMTVPNYHN